MAIYVFFVIVHPSSHSSVGFDWLHDCLTLWIDERNLRCFENPPQAKNVSKIDEEKLETVT